MFFASAITAGLLLASTVDARANPVLYAVAASDAFGTVDVQTGAFTQTGTLSGNASGPEDLAGLPGGALYAPLGNADLVTVDPSTAKCTLVGNMGNAIIGLKFRGDGVLFGASHTDLYTIDTATAQATHVGAFGVPSSSYFDLAFDDQNNLYMTQSTGSLYKVDATTGAASAIGPIGFTMGAADFDQGTLYGFTTDFKIITIDTSTGAGKFLANVSPTGSLVYGATLAAGETTVDGGATGVGGTTGSADAGGDVDVSGSAGTSGADASTGSTDGGSSSGGAGGTTATGSAGSAATGGAGAHPTMASGGSGCSCSFVNGPEGRAPGMYAPWLALGAVVAGVVGRRRRRARPRRP